MADTAEKERVEIKLDEDAMLAGLMSCRRCDGHMLPYYEVRNPNAVVHICRECNYQMPGWVF